MAQYMQQVGNEETELANYMQPQWASFEMAYYQQNPELVLAQSQLVPMEYQQQIFYMPQQQQLVQMEQQLIPESAPQNVMDIEQENAMTEQEQNEAPAKFDEPADLALRHMVDGVPTGRPFPALFTCPSNSNITYSGQHMMVYDPVRNVNVWHEAPAQFSEPADLALRHMVDGVPTGPPFPALYTCPANSDLIYSGQWMMVYDPVRNVNIWHEVYYYETPKSMVDRTPPQKAAIFKNQPNKKKFNPKNRHPQHQRRHSKSNQYIPENQQSFSEHQQYVSEYQQNIQDQQSFQEHQQQIQDHQRFQENQQSIQQQQNVQEHKQHISENQQNTLEHQQYVQDSENMEIIEEQKNVDCQYSPDAEILPEELVEEVQYQDDVNQKELQEIPITDNMEVADDTEKVQSESEVAAKMDDQVPDANFDEAVGVEQEKTEEIGKADESAAATTNEISAVSKSSTVTETAITIPSPPSNNLNENLKPADSGVVVDVEKTSCREVNQANSKPTKATSKKSKKSNKKNLKVPIQLGDFEKASSSKNNQANSQPAKAHSKQLKRSNQNDFDYCSDDEEVPIQFGDVDIKEIVPDWTSYTRKSNCGEDFVDDGKFSFKTYKSKKFPAPKMAKKGPKNPKKQMKMDNSPVDRFKLSASMSTIAESTLETDSLDVKESSNKESFDGSVPVTSPEVKNASIDKDSTQEEDADETLKNSDSISSVQEVAEKIEIKETCEPKKTEEASENLDVIDSLPKDVTAIPEIQNSNGEATDQDAQSVEVKSEGSFNESFNNSLCGSEENFSDASIITQIDVTLIKQTEILNEKLEKVESRGEEMVKKTDDSDEKKVIVEPKDWNTILEEEEEKEKLKKETSVGKNAEEKEIKVNLGAVKKVFNRGAEMELKPTGDEHKLSQSQSSQTTSTNSWKQQKLVIPKGAIVVNYDDTFPPLDSAQACPKKRNNKNAAGGQNRGRGNKRNKQDRQNVAKNGQRNNYTPAENFSGFDYSYHGNSYAQRQNGENGHHNSQNNERRNHNDQRNERQNSQNRRENSINNRRQNSRNIVRQNAQSERQNSGRQNENQSGRDSKQSGRQNGQRDDNNNDGGYKTRVFRNNRRSNNSGNNSESAKSKVA